MLTPGQQPMFRDLVRRAWLAHALRSGLDESDKLAQERWYRQQLMEVLGIYTTKECNPTWELDLLLIRFATIAGDDAMAAHATASAERRVKYCIRSKVAELSRLDGQPYGWPYIVAIYRRMSAHHALPDDIDDCPADLLVKVLHALDTHLRRHRVAARETHNAA